MEEKELRAEAGSLSSGEAYRHVYNDFTAGLLRLALAEAVFLETILRESLVKNWHPSRNEEITVQEWITERSPRSDLACFHYVTLTGYFVYATSVFDTFLAETVRFLLLRSPSSLGEKYLVPIGTLVSARLRSEIINERVGKKAKQLGYSERLQFLGTVGANIDVAAHSDSLARLSAIRNEAVHDQASLGLEMSSTERLLITRKGHPLGPRKIDGKDIKEATHTFASVATAIYQAVLRDVLGLEEDADANIKLDMLLSVGKR